MDLITLALAKKYTDKKQEEAVSTEAIKQAVDDYMAGHPETDPTVPEWAKQPEKPPYTASEVGALPADTPIPEGIPIPPSAQVGQTIVVKAVDEAGVPTEWEPADMPSGWDIPIGGMELISSGVLTEDASIRIEKDSSGNAFELSEAVFLLVGTYAKDFSLSAVQINDVEWLVEFSATSVSKTVAHLKKGQPLKVKTLSGNKVNGEYSNLTLTSDDSGNVSLSGVISDNIIEVGARNWSGGAYPAAGTIYALYGVRA